MISAIALVPTTSTRRLVVRSTTQPQVPLESRTPPYMAARAPSEKRMSARCGLSAATHTRPVVAPIAAGTHGPSAYGAFALAACRLTSQIPAASVIANSPPVPS